MILRRLQKLAIGYAAKRHPDRVIGPGNGDYLHRWYIIPRNRLLNIYLHHFRRSDDDRALHDHPWWSASLLLQGEYTEHQIARGGINTRRIYRAGRIILRGARHTHRIELHAGACWTLFLTGPVIRRWGFHCPNGWRHWRVFTDPASGHNAIGRGCD